MAKGQSMDDLGNACSGFDEAAIDELKEIVAQYRTSRGSVINLSSKVGEWAESMFEKRVPENWQPEINELVEAALKGSYEIAFTTQPDEQSSSVLNRALAWAQGERWHNVASALSGAVGGFGGIGTTLLEIPVTTTLALRAIQQVAFSYGEDVSNEAVRAQCIAVLTLGGPLKEDDEADVGFFATRVAVNHLTVSQAIKTVLPRFGLVISEKVLAQAIPVVGALAGAAINSTFVNYYQIMAHVHFRLRRLERAHSSDQVRACFDRILKPPPKSVNLKLNKQY